MIRYALTALVLLAGPALAQAPADPAGPVAQETRPARGSMEAVERHIAGLKSRLKITPAQQSQWDLFAGVMRQNASHMVELQRDRSTKVATLTALQDIKSYADVARAHAEDLQRLVPAFETLYMAMSPEQRVTADQTFQNFQGRRSRKTP